MDLNQVKPIKFPARPFFKTSSIQYYLILSTIIHEEGVGPGATDCVCVETSYLKLLPEALFGLLQVVRHFVEFSYPVLDVGGNNPCGVEGLRCGRGGTKR